MRNVRPGGPDYRLCDQTVTLYRASFGQGGAFSCRKWVLPRAFLDITATEKLNAGEYRQERSFLLVVPLGEGMELPRPGDRVLRGEAPHKRARTVLQAFGLRSFHRPRRGHAIQQKLLQAPFDCV